MSETKNKHTPGPWTIAKDESIEVITIDAGDAAVADAYGDGLRERRANAHLIAAAPDMLDALENLTIAIGMGWDLDGVIAAAAAAIKKARGEK